MEAARLIKVEDRLDLGTDALSGQAGSQNSGKTVTSGLAKGTAGPGPMPTPAKNSGTNLNTAYTQPVYTVMNGEGRQYAGRDDSKAKGTVTDSEGGNFQPSGDPNQFQSSVK
jgi:hypothetical protein